MAAVMQQQRWPLSLWLVISGSILGAAAVILSCLRLAMEWDARQWAILVALAVGTAAAAQFQLELPYAKEESSYEVTDILWIGALLLVSSEILLVAVPIGVILGQAVRGWDTVKVLFNAAQHTLGMTAAVAVYLFISPGDVTHPATWLAAVVASIVYHGVNTLAMGTVIALAERTPFSRAAVAPVGLRQAVGNVALAILGALLWSTEPLALVLLVPPVVLMYVAYQAWLRTLQERDAMRDMARTADDVARSGNFATRLPEPPSQDDASVLAITLNRMLARLDGSMQRERRFIRETSHELRTPITIVRGHLEVLGPRPTTQELDETTELVLDELNLMARLVEDMSLLARMEDAASLRYGDVSVEGLITAVAAKVEPLIDRPLTLSLPQNDDVIRADEQRLTQALINLVSNAKAHTPPNTSIALSAVRREKDWLFQVCDDGGGLPPGEEVAAFEPFHTGGTATAGTGLGLAIVAGIAKAHGGAAGVDNRPGQGATFWVSVPR